MIWISSIISSFKISKVDPFPALTARFPLVFISDLLIAFEVNLSTNPGKISLVKVIATFVSAFLSKNANQKPNAPPDWIILDILSLLSFISVNYY